MKNFPKIHWKQSEWALNILMLSQSFQDMTLIKEVSLPLWGEIFKATGIPQEEARVVASHDAVLTLLQAQSDNMYLLDALDTLLSLGTEGGRAALELIGRDQGIQLPFLEKEGAREYACRFWLRAASDKDFGRLLLQARLQPQEGGTRRAFREFAGKVGGKSVQFGKDLLVQAIVEICEKTQRGEVVEVFEYQGEPVYQWVILRGDLIRQQLQVKDRKTGLLIYRPAISDLVRFDTSNGRLGRLGTVPIAEGQGHGGRSGRHWFPGFPPTGPSRSGRARSGRWGCY